MDDSLLEPEVPFAGEEGESLVGQTLLERARGMGVGTEDPTIIGEAGPTDTPPGADPEAT